MARFLCQELRSLKIIGKGQVTFAQALVEQAGLHPRSAVEFEAPAHGDGLPCAARGLAAAGLLVD